MLRSVLFTSLLIIIISCGTKPKEVTTVTDTALAIKPKTDSIRKTCREARLMNIVRQTAYDSFALRYKDSMFTSSYKGRVFTSDTTGKNLQFLFDLKSEFLIDKMFLLPLGQSSYFIAWQQTDHTGVRSYFAVYDRGRSEPVWKSLPEGPTPGVPVIDSNEVYVSTLGMIAKLDLRTGATIWKHDSLFDQYKLTFKFFNKPLVYPHTVCFYDSPIKGKKGKSDSIWVDDNSGKIIPRPRAK